MAHEIGLEIQIFLHLGPEISIIMHMVDVYGIGSKLCTIHRTGCLAKVFVDDIDARVNIGAQVPVMLYFLMHALHDSLCPLRLDERVEAVSFRPCQIIRSDCPTYALAKLAEEAIALLVAVRAVKRAELKSVEIDNRPLPLFFTTLVCIHKGLEGASENSGAIEAGYLIDMSALSGEGNRPHGTEIGGQIVRCDLQHGGAGTQKFIRNIIHGNEAMETSAIDQRTGYDALYLVLHEFLVHLWRLFRVGLHICNHETMIRPERIEPFMSESLFGKILQLVLIGWKIRLYIFC